MTGRRKAKVIALICTPDLHSVENNHQFSQWNSMCAMTDGESGSRRILTLAPTEGYGDKKPKEMGWTEPCLGLCGKAYEPTQGARKVKATGPGISLNLQSKRPWWQIKNTFVWLKWSEKLTWINMSVQGVRIKNYYKAIVLSASLSGTGEQVSVRTHPSSVHPAHRVKLLPEVQTLAHDVVSPST